MFLRSVPPELTEGVASGIYRVTGSVVRDVATGRGVAFLQETGVMQQLVGAAISGAGNTLKAGFNPLGIISVIQNEQIKSRLTGLQKSISLLQNLQVGTLAVSGLGLGVSVIGFSLMLSRLKGIEAQLGTIEGQIGKVTLDRRSDDLSGIFSDIGTHLETVDSLSARKNKLGSAEASEQALATCAGRLQMHIQQSSAAIKPGEMTVGHLEFVWSLASAIRLCHEASHRALFMINELEAAEKLAAGRAQRFLELRDGFSPETLSRLHAGNELDPAAYATKRRDFMPLAEALVYGLHNSVASVGSQAELAGRLVESGISGPSYVSALEEETEVPLLILPA